MGLHETIHDRWRHTRWAVVADGKRCCLRRINVPKSVTNHGRTSHLLGTLPYDLSEMAPLIEAGHVGVGLAKERLEESKFVIVHQVGDHLANVR